MKRRFSKIFLLSILAFGGDFSARGQIYEDPRLRAERERILAERDAARRRQEDFQTLKRELERNTGNGSRNSSSVANRVSKKERRRTEADLARVAVENEDLGLYKQILSQPDAGLFRLQDFSICAKTKAQCPEFIPGYGTAFSFQKILYEDKFFADISFENSMFQLQGFNTLGFLTNLGDLPLADLSLETGGIREMAEFTPSDKFEEIQSHVQAAKKGFQVGNFVYQASLPLKNDSTYALRSILYEIRKKSDAAEKINGRHRPEPGRKDIIIVFRVVRRHADGSVTLLWKRLREKDSPIVFVNDK